jgi:hypothetical protein
LAVLCRTGAGIAAEEFPWRVRAQIKTTINTIGRPITSTMAIAANPNMKKPPDIMAIISFQLSLYELDSMPAGVQP